MTAKEKKDYLRQIYRLDRRIELDRRKIEKLRAVLDYKPPSGGSGSGGSADRIPDTSSLSANPSGMMRREPTT
jgi:hypothetical protein